MSENVKQVTVIEMLRTTGENTKEFMNRIANHVEYLEGHVADLESEVAKLRDRVSQFEGKLSDSDAQ